MPQHISIRVPWHDNGWNGTVCKDPKSNNSCLRLKNVSENRDDEAETDICGKCMAKYVNKLCCIGEGACFMSPEEIEETKTHPYKFCFPEFLPTDEVYPPYSFPARPYAWLIKRNLEEKKDIYKIDYKPEREPKETEKEIWVQDAENQKPFLIIFMEM